MPNHPTATTITQVAALTQQGFARIGTALVAAFQAMRRHADTTFASQDYERDSIADLNPRLLKDIGVAQWHSVTRRYAHDEYGYGYGDQHDR